MATRTRKSSKERKAEIVAATIRLAGKIGPDRLTTLALAKEVGISEAGIFRHFSTKGEIWEAVADHIGSLLQAKSVLSDNDERSPVDQLRNFVIEHLTFIEATPAIPAILFSRELHAENDHLRSFFAGLISRRQVHFSSLITTEIDAGNFREDLDPDDAAILILALVQGTAMRWSLNAGSFDLVEEGRRLLELLLSGFKAHEKALMQSTA